MRRQRERNGVRVGQPVRDVDGTPLGRVVRLFEWGFQTRRGLPILRGREFLLRYDELCAVRDGVLVVARSDRDLFELAAGQVPRSWRVPTPPAYPTAATPAEARNVRDEVAAGRVPGAAPSEGEGEGEPDTEQHADRARAGRPITEEELRAYVRTRGQGLGPQRTPSDGE